MWGNPVALLGSSIRSGERPCARVRAFRTFVVSANIRVPQPPAGRLPLRRAVCAWEVRYEQDIAQLQAQQQSMQAAMDELQGQVAWLMRLRRSTRAGKDASQETRRTCALVNDSWARNAG